MTKTHQPFGPLTVLIACIITVGYSYIISAQVPGVKSSDLRRDEEMTRREREVESAKKKREPKDVLAEVNDDLSRLNALNEVITNALAANTPVDYPAFSERAAEIKARSTRLKSNLALPVDEKAEKQDPMKGIDNTTLGPSLSILGKLLTSFTHNPIFSDTGAIDMELAVKARQDLEDIIIVSEKVHKAADKLSKAKH